MMDDLEYEDMIRFLREQGMREDEFLPAFVLRLKAERNAAIRQAELSEELRLRTGPLAISEAEAWKSIAKLKEFQLQTLKASQN